MSCPKAARSPDLARPTKARLFAVAADRAGISATCGVSTKDPFTPETLELVSLTVRRLQREGPWGLNAIIFGWPSPASLWTLAAAEVLALGQHMTDPAPLKPFKLTPPRILILVLGVLALVMIIGAIAGGVGNYQALREANQASAAPASASSTP